MPSRGRKRLEVEQGGICFYCKKPWRYPTIDHVLPRKAAPPSVFDDFRNKVIACMTCNHMKSNRLPTDQELERLFALKRRYAEVDYELSLVEPEPQTEWLCP